MGSTETISLQQIRDRAYDLWERNHRPEGMEIEFWIQAERELRSERDQRRRAEQAAGGHEPDPSR